MSAAMAASASARMGTVAADWCVAALTGVDPVLLVPSTAVSRTAETGRVL